jgi:hypothetical protein
MIILTNNEVNTLIQDLRASNYRTPVLELIDNLKGAK